MAETPKTVPTREPAFMKIVITPDVFEKVKAFKESWEGTQVEEVKLRAELGNGTAHEVTLTMEEFLEAVGLGVAAKIIKKNAE